jgi:hypothetical protein
LFRGWLSPQLRSNLAAMAACALPIRALLDRDQWIERETSPLLRCSAWRRAPEPALAPLGTFPLPLPPALSITELEARHAENRAVARLLAMGRGGFEPPTDGL